MKIPFLKQIQRLVGPAANEIILATPDPAGGSVRPAMEYLLAELPDLLLAAVMEVASGRPLATYTAERELRPGIIGAFECEAVRQAQAGLLAQGPAGPAERLEEMLVTLPSQLHLMRLDPSGRTLVYLAVDRRDTNLGIAREVIRRSIERLQPQTGK